jgi:outer membrane protein OmpU
MKKVLLATSILAASAGFAAAEVAVTGTARMGVFYDGTDAMFSSRFRVIFTASGETDGGLSFGASVRNDQLGNGNTANGDSTVYISGAFGKLTMGDTGNAADALVGQVSGVGYTGLGSVNEIGWLGTTKTGALYEYSTGAFTVAVGSAQTTALAGSDSVSVAVKYATDAYSVALGYEDVTGNNQLSLLGSAGFGGATVKLKVAKRDVAVDDTATALSVDYTTGAATITAFATDNFDFAGTNSFGIGAAYDLGGGAKVVGGVVDNGVDTVADLGVTMSF